MAAPDLEPVMPAPVPAPVMAESLPPPVIASEPLSQPVTDPVADPVVQPAVVPPDLKSSRPAAVAARSMPPVPPRAGTKFMMPVKGPIISGYGPKADGLYNDGINIKAPAGTPVKAADNGVVVYAGDELKGFGNLILVRHADRWVTAYAHMGSMKVTKGDIVKRGQSIGTVGSTGSVDSPQLHFETRRGTEALNPQMFMEQS
jgi:murein DD-endopeptidase MepM/ murein hydrolase activator NlpD